jgi:glyoxylase-like metal-dependent hydrolase (beta-lactamase superfamily II)
MTRPEYKLGLAPLSSHTFAYLQPDGGFGLSNAGLVAGKSGALLVDTLFDLPLTRRMLDEIARRVPVPIQKLVNTHHNGDHCWGNQLLHDAEIIGHRRCAEEMPKLPPAVLQALRGTGGTPPVSRLLAKAMQRFDFSGIEITPPTTLFDERLSLEVDGVRVELIYVGPAHTAGDVIVHLPDEGIVFAGDIIFRLCAPIGWEGTFARWIEALERIAALGAETIVPGHGPLCGAEGALEMRDYLIYVRDASARHFAAGRTSEEAARQIDLGPYADWGEPERVIFTVERAYRELRGEPYDAPIDFVRMARVMDELAVKMGRLAPAS